MKRRGVTLIELLVVLGINGLLVTSIVAAFQVGMRFQKNVPLAEVQFQADLDFERNLETLFKAAYLSDDDADTTTYFLMYASGGNLAEPDTLVMTCVGIPPIGAFLNSEEEFEDLNDQFGPQGGIVEISISTLPVGDAPVDQGVFLRVQSPSDGDFTQGGYESVLREDIIELRVYFFDGVDWIEEWNTFTGQRRLPAAILVEYQLEDEEDQRSFIVRLPNSDVTPEDPLTQEIIQ